MLGIVCVFLQDFFPVYFRWDSKSEKRFLQRKYWALVLGSPRRPQGLISVPLGKVGISISCWLLAFTHFPVSIFSVECMDTTTNVLCIVSCEGGNGWWKIRTDYSCWKCLNDVIATRHNRISSSWFFYSWFVLCCNRYCTTCPLNRMRLCLVIIKGKVGHREKI